MHISQDSHTGNVINKYQNGLITINEAEYTSDLAITLDAIIDDLDLSELPLLSEKACQRIKNLNIDILLFGTGDTQHPIPPKIQGFFAELGIGCETMTSSAACHTYTVLASEERRVCALIKV